MKTPEKCPYSFEALCEAFEYIYDSEPAFDPYLAMMRPDEAAQEIWDSLEDVAKEAILEYEG